MVGRGSSMKNISTFIFVVVGALIVGGGAFLATWDIPAPVKKVERTIPNENFPK